MMRQPILNENDAVIRMIRRLSSVEANQVLGDAWWGGKNRNLRRVEHDYTGNHDGSGYVEIRIPLALIRPNELGDRYDGTVDSDRLDKYVLEEITTPVHLLFGRRASKIGVRHAAVMDGGHRVSAARLRGDIDIRAIMLKSDLDRLLAEITCLKLLEIEEEKSQLLHGMWKPQLDDENEIAAYISEFSPYDVSEEIIQEYFSGRMATLEWVLLSEIEEGDPDHNVPDQDKQKDYDGLSLDSMPPIVVENGKIQDGNHRYRSAVKKQAEKILAYVTRPAPELCEDYLPTIG